MLARPNCATIQRAIDGMLLVPQVLRGNIDRAAISLLLAAPLGCLACGARCRFARTLLASALSSARFASALFGGLWLRATRQQDAAVPALDADGSRHPQPGVQLVCRQSRLNRCSSFQLRCPPVGVNERKPSLQRAQLWGVPVDGGSQVLH